MQLVLEHMHEGLRGWLALARVVELQQLAILACVTVSTQYVNF